MLSRTAHCIYWMCRYLERADNVARFINVNTHLILDMVWERQTAQWEPLVHASSDEEDFARRYGEPSEENVIRFLTFDTENPNSIISCVQKARENARTAREALSTEMWEAINALYHLVEKRSRNYDIADLQGFFAQVWNGSHLFTGLMENTMSHGEAWHFARLGRLLERADKTGRILDVKYFVLLPTPDYFDSPYDTVEWGAVLKSVSGFKMYCRQYHRANYRDVAKFLIFDAHFPRAMHYCVRTAQRSLLEITEMLGVAVPAQREMETLQAMIDTTSVDSVLQSGLHEYIDRFQYQLNVVDASLFHSFFALR